MGMGRLGGRSSWAFACSDGCESREVGECVVIHGERRNCTILRSWMAYCGIQYLLWTLEISPYQKHCNIVYYHQKLSCYYRLRDGLLNSKLKYKHSYLSIVDKAATSLYQGSLPSDKRKQASDQHKRMENYTFELK